VKIDVEGAELSVLRAAQATLEEFRPDVFVEVHPRELRDQGYEVVNLKAILADRGYKLRWTRHRSQVTDATWQTFVPEHLPDDETFLLHAQP
jgi:hypothetical protein